MKIGVKTYNDFNFLKYFEDKSDFFEIQAIQTNDYSLLKDFSLPIVIHAEHQGFGVDLSNKNKEEFNLKSINFAIKIANFSNAKKIIIHPGESGSINQTIKILNKINDDRFLIENMMNNWIGSTPEDLKEILKNTNVGFCFDVGHAIINSNRNHLNEIKVIKDFLKLKPSHFHIGGLRKINGIEQDHFQLRGSNRDFKEILSFYPKDSEITLETTTKINEVEDDIKFIRKIIK